MSILSMDPVTDCSVSIGHKKRARRPSVLARYAVPVRLQQLDGGLDLSIRGGQRRSASEVLCQAPVEPGVGLGQVP